MIPELDLDSPVCDCGAPSDPARHPPLPQPLPLEHGRPCERNKGGQFTAGSAMLHRRVRAKPTAAMQPVIRSQAAQRAVRSTAVTRCACGGDITATGIDEASLERAIRIHGTTMRHREWQALAGFRVVETIARAG